MKPFAFIKELIVELENQSCFTGDPFITFGVLSFLGTLVAP
ncbi:MAG TPA: hypothetical protein PK075_01225 [Chitinophagales bacterium]|nr:hypothetical protein [Chitinophagales bacterium]